MIEEINKILRHEANAILNIPVNYSYEKAVNLIYEHVHVQHGKVVASGMGKAGQIALNIATTLSSTGTPAVFMHPAEAQHGDLGIIQPNDVLLLISNSGKTREIVELIGLVRNLYSHIPYILITSNPETDLAQNANVLLPTGNPQEVCILGLTPTTSTTVMTVIGDILVVLLMKKINFTHEEYAKRHHGGYLGQKSRFMVSSKEKPKQ
ncbi:MAG TPA: SIS domain-containing protein [Bacteroidales bacterium]|nr:SIS domain-containing protein [Bacteroidales bacterium]HPO65287.1 SIS domain-containing protein [Bacteroidales bacterium]